MEVGWSDDIPKRLKQHLNNASTTPLFGLCNAMTRQHPVDGGWSWPEPWQLALFPVWERKVELAGVAEAVGSILCSSYIHHGGFNIELAGYSTASAQSATALKFSKQDLWDASATETETRLSLYKTVDEETQRAVKEHDQGLHFQRQEQREQNKQAGPAQLNKESIENLQSDQERQVLSSKAEDLGKEFKQQQTFNAAQDAQRSELVRKVQPIVDQVRRIQDDNARLAEELEEVEARDWVVGDMTLSDATRRHLAEIEEQSKGSEGEEDIETAWAAAIKKSRERKAKAIKAKRRAEEEETEETEDAEDAETEEQASTYSTRDESQEL